MEEETIVNEPVIEAEPAEEVTEAAPPGAKTEPELLLKSLQEERDKRRELETELAKLKEVPDPLVEIYSEEGKALQAEIRQIKGALASSQTETKLSKLQNEFPALKDKEIEFKSFISDPENTGISIERAAKLFLAENNLLQAPARKGLEKPTGGVRAPTKVGMTPEEIDELRVSNFQEYSKRIRAGTLV